MFSLIYAGETSRQHRVAIVSRPSIPAAEESIENNTEIPGRVYGLAERSGYYQDVQIAVDFNYRARTEEEWTSIYRDCTLWLRRSGELKFSDDLAAFYRVRCVTVGDVERANRLIGRFTATFTCQPGTYFETGKQWLELTRAGSTGPLYLYNYHSMSQPVYEITGSGECTLTVNGNAMKATVDGAITIDTDLWIAYHTKEENTAVTGDYDGLYLQPGKNTITISDGFSLRVKPNWRII